MKTFKLLLVATLIATTTCLERSKRFYGSEHEYIGNHFDDFKILVGAGANNSEGVPNPSNRVMYKTVSPIDYHFVNDLNETIGTYGDIIGFAGDYFGAGSFSEVICNGFRESVEEGERRFMKAFSLLYDADVASVLDSVRVLWKQEQDVMSDPENQSLPPWQRFAKLKEPRYLKALGRYFFTYLNLANYNYDHFGTCGTDAYRAGHMQALALAKSAGSLVHGHSFDNLPLDKKGQALTQARSMLLKAYAVNAFADHFLSDAFAAGHVRTIRQDLVNFCVQTKPSLTPTYVAELDGGLASQWCHDEDNRNGLHVTNARGDSWVAYGDGNYFDDRARRGRELVAEAIGISAQEVFKQFLNPDLEPHYTALRLTPLPNSANLYPDENPCALYIVDPNNSTRILVRTPRIEIRTNSWLKANGFSPLNSNDAGCNYQEATRDEACPNSVKAKAGLGVTAQLYWYPARQFFVSAFADPASNETKAD
eukprot:Colp12_sorted_trinity150504_noHs@34192